MQEDKKEKKNIINSILHIDFLSGNEIVNLPFLPILKCNNASIKKKKDVTKKAITLIWKSVNSINICSENI